MLTCPTHKRTYASREAAEEALRYAQGRFHYRPGQGPVAVYRCDDCGFYHLTSKGTMNDSLASGLRDGSVQRQREANAWIDKLKRKK
jgi:hypothetical protein